MQFIGLFMLTHKALDAGIHISTGEFQVTCKNKTAH